MSLSTTFRSILSSSIPSFIVDMYIVEGLMEDYFVTRCVTLLKSIIIFLLFYKMKAYTVILTMIGFFLMQRGNSPSS